VVVGVAHAAVDLLIDEAKIKLEEQKSEILTEQSAQIEYSTQKMELINSAAVVKTKYLQFEGLELEISYAKNNLAQSFARLGALYSRAEQLFATKARGQALARNQGNLAIAYRLYANHQAQIATRDQRAAIQWAYLATRALEYQLNMSIDQGPLWAARSPSELGSYLLTLTNTAASAGTAQGRVDVISLREKILGLNSPIKDVASGAIISAKERFRQFVLSPKNRDEKGNLRIQFSTSDETNPIFSSILGSDRIRGLKVNLVGDNLGAGVTQAEVQLIHGGTSYLRARMKTNGVAALTAFDMTGKDNQPTLALVQASINAPNSMGQTVENTELQERATLAGPWQLIIDQSAGTPANANLNLAGIDDIELIVRHDAYTIQ
jgi:hypothetical protein